MDEDLLAGSLLILFGLLIFLSRLGVVSNLLLLDIWPALMIISGLIFLYFYFKKSN